MSSVAEKIQQRRFQIVDRKKQSQPNLLKQSSSSDDSTFHTPGSDRLKDATLSEEEAITEEKDAVEEEVPKKHAVKETEEAKEEEEDKAEQTTEEAAMERDEEGEEMDESGKEESRNRLRRHTMVPIIVETMESEREEREGEEGREERRKQLSFAASASDSEDIRSQLSFIMRERLHSFVKEVQRRTSDVREGLLQETDDDVVSTTEIGEKRPSLSSLIGVQKGEIASEARTVSWWRLTLDPSSNIHMLWLFVVTSAFLFNALGIPLRSSYPYQTERNLIYWLVLDYLSDTVYFLDMVIWKPRLHFMKGGIATKDLKETAQHYIGSWTFRVDLFSILPFEVLYLWKGPIAIFRLNRLAKVGAFWHLFDLLDNSFSNPYAIRIAKTLSYMIYIIHCNSCVYYLLSAWQAFGQIAYQVNGKWYLNKWVYNNQGNAYIRCFYFTAAVATSTGNNPAPTNVIEYIYMTFSWMMGVFVFALLLGQIRDIVSNANRNQEEYRRKMDAALTACSRASLPPHLTSRVRDWFIYTWEQHKTLDEKKLIERLPLKLQTDLALSVHYNTLSKVTLFQDCDRALLRDLVLKLRAVIFLPGDMVCKKGDVGKEMYIVNQGVLQVVGGDNNEIVFAEMGQGKVFGEISLLAIGGNNRRTASIRAKGYATLFVLSKEDLQEAIKYYPQAQAILKKKAAEMLRNDKKAAESGKQEKSLEDTCKLSINPTPKMLEVVAQVLPEERETTRILKRAISEDRGVAPARTETARHSPEALSEVEEEQSSQ